jgi:DNA-binding CsgD family transcriptional regulator
VPDVVLSSGEQAALSTLLAAEPVPGSPLPDRRVLEVLHRLIPCDALGGHLYERSGKLVAAVDLPSGFLARLEERHVRTSADDRPTLRLGVRQLLHTGLAPAMRADGITDSLHFSLITPEGNVVDLWLDRTHRPFEDRDLALLAMLAPLLRRLVSERMTIGGVDSLTLQERRVLKLVAGGLSNSQIAHRLTVSPSTVRKHLEHAYRKLGVGNRMAAVAALHGCDDPRLDLRERLERFA